MDATLDTAESIRQTIHVLDALYCGAVLIAPDGSITYANRRFCHMMERPESELIGHRIWDFFPPDEAFQLRYDFAQYADKEVEREAALPRAGGGFLPVIISSRPLDGTTPLCGYRIYTVIDISQQKQAEQNFHDQYQEVARLSDTVLEQAIQLKRYSQTLEKKIAERTAELREANLDSILMLAVASEARDTDTGAHVLRIKEYTELLALHVGMPETEAENLGFSAILHDVGKIHVPDEILKKPGRFTPEERKAMEYHTIAGERILSQRPFFEQARQIARSHHENWDGSGYPDGLAGEKIPLPARIVHLVDVFDALTSPRVYKPAWSLEDTIREIERCSGTMFDPSLVKVFLPLARGPRVRQIMMHRDPPKLGPTAFA